MSVHFKHLAEMKTLLETKTLTNDGILELDNYKERSEVHILSMSTSCVLSGSHGSTGVVAMVLLVWQPWFRISAPSRDLRFYCKKIHIMLQIHTLCIA